MSVASVHASPQPSPAPGFEEARAVWSPRVVSAAEWIAVSVQSVLEGASPADRRRVLAHLHRAVDEAAGRVSV